MKKKNFNIYFTVGAVNAIRQMFVMEVNSDIVYFSNAAAIFWGTIVVRIKLLTSKAISRIKRSLF